MSDNKKWLKLVFKQIQPIHIGMGNYGIINETRIFIPGWTMWGALTNTFGRKNRWGKEDWEKKENQKLFEKISCFYPCFDEKGDNPLLPKFKNGEFYLGDYSESEFRAKFVDTFVSSAINPISRMATDESLHEIDIILPGIKRDFLENKKENQFYWVGILSIKNEIKNFLQKGLKITVGGDVRYGLGLMEFVKIEEEKEQNKELFNKLKKANYLTLTGQQNLSASYELIIETKGYEGNNLKIKNPEYYYILSCLNEHKELSLIKGKLENKD